MSNKLFELLLIDKLSPLFLIRDLRITKVAFDYLINIINIKYHKSLIQGGEMGGPVAAQSIGEISTQLTLNSVEWNTEILIEVDGILKREKIGEWIDKRINNAEYSNVEYHPNDTTLQNRAIEIRIKEFH